MRVAFAVGIVMLLGGIGITVIGLIQTPVDRFITVTGVVVAILGGIAIPHSGLGGAVQVIVTAAGPYIPKFGGQRAGDPPAPPKI